MRRRLSGAIRVGLGALIIAAGLSAPAIAQQADPQAADTIIVTGSRIRVDPLQQGQPVITLGGEEIGKTGLSSTADVLQHLPVASGGFNQRNNNSGNFGNPPDGGGVGAGASEIDLRYLGSRRVLVLVDGLRWVQGSSASGVPGSVDLNTIPTGMIDRIEVLQEGASPIYGSDAIAGVVNIITKKNQDGIQASAQYGGYIEEGDGRTEEYNFSIGINDEKTRAILGLNYVDQDGVLASDRDISQFPTPGATSCLGGGCSGGTPLGHFIITDPNTGTAFDATLRAALAPGVVPAYTPANPTGPASGFRAFLDPADRFNFQPYNYVVTPSERLSAFGLFTHDFADNLHLQMKTTYTNRRSANQAAPIPLFIGPDAGNGNLLDTVGVDVTNPFNPFGFTLGPGTLTVIGRRVLEAGPRHYEQNVDTWNVTGTLYGDYQLFNRQWFWDVNAVWSRNQADQTFTGNLNAQRVQQALGPIAGCTTASGCVPLNLFGGPGTITPAMLNFIGFTQQDKSEQELRDFSANVTGELFNLPAGPVEMAIGAEHRENSGFFQPDPIVAAGLSSDIPAQPASGKIEIDEAYVEFNVPVLKDLPFARELTVNLAARAFDYSTFGWDKTYRAGANWRPVDDVLLRASWSEGFRAPSIGELFGTASRFDQELADPCSDFLGLNGGPVQPVGVRNNCVTLGVPANGSYRQLNPQISVITSGSQALVPETSEAFNAGIVWDPSFLRDQPWTRGMTFEVNYADIKLDDAIQAQNGQALLNRCAQTLDPLACASITRTASGQVSTISNPLINIGGIKTKQVDFTVAYGAPSTPIGNFDLRLSVANLAEFTEFVQTAAGLAPVSREGTERGSPDQAYPEWKGSFGVDWSLGSVGGSLLARYVSDVTEPNANQLDSITYLDAQFRFTPDFMNEKMTLTLGMNNLTDEDPPGCFSCGLNNFDPTTYDAPGRFGYIRIAWKD
jgi:iron complex outermembrane recepter protein